MEKWVVREAGGDLGWPSKHSVIDTGGKSRKKHEEGTYEEVDGSGRDERGMQRSYYFCIYKIMTVPNFLPSSFCVEWRNSTPHFTSVTNPENEKRKYFISLNEKRIHKLSRLQSHTCTPAPWLTRKSYYLMSKYFFMYKIIILPIFSFILLYSK